MTVNRPALALFGLVIWGALAGSLWRAPGLSSYDTVVLVGLLTAFALLLTIGAALLTGALERHGRRSVTLAGWVLVFLAAAVAACDAISYYWLSLHLTDSVLMLYWYVRANPVGISAKLAGLAAWSGLLIAAAIAAAIVAERIGRRAPRRSSRALALAVCAAAAVFVALDAAAARTVSLQAYHARRHALLVPQIVQAGDSRSDDYLFVIEAPAIRQLPPLEEGRAQLEAITPASVAEPLNVFFFVVESLRADTARSPVMPALAALAPQALSGRVQAAGGNCTFISWVSLMHGVNPAYWTVRLRQPRHEGSAPVAALKRAGYRTHAYSSYELSYFGADRALFGSDLALADEIMGQEALSQGLDSPNVAELDVRVFERLRESASRHGATGRNLYFAFLGAMHHNYEWPRDFRPPFTPFMSDADVVLRGMRPSQAPLLRARYDNAARFTDGLFDRFFAFLDDARLREHSIVVIAGDHGEEFMEEGRLVHSSALNRYQIETPIMVFLPPAMHASLPERPAGRSVASHADAFPTVMRALGLDDDIAGLMTGTPLMDEDTFAVSALCSTNEPERLLVQTPESKLLVEFDGIRKRGYSLFARELRGIALLDARYQRMDPPAHGAGVLARRDIRAALSSFLELGK